MTTCQVKCNGSRLQVKVQLDETASDILYRDNAKLYFQVSPTTITVVHISYCSTQACGRSGDTPCT